MIHGSRTDGKDSGIIRLANYDINTNVSKFKACTDEVKDNMWIQGLARLRIHILERRP
jgi:hypothetical protein